MALLRSLAVDPRYRNQGLAFRLKEKAEEYAASLNIEVLYLLTMTAERFFSKRGYQRMARNSVSPQVQEAAEFQSLC
ncbi:MAG: GNAT family N-acetyltransferase, partial [Deltaproteobacteria bacterium]|nr:GNAT family N-acetyltransferase [Deltaproteobacteria bacterium]